MWKLMSVWGVVLSGALTASAADVSVREYPSIQAAIDANPGKEIFVPAGDHVVEATVRITGEGTALVGSGRIVMADPARHILEIEHAEGVRVEGLTFTRAEGKEETTREGILINDAKDVVLEKVKVIDNRTRSGSLRLQGVTNGRVLNCEVVNYMSIAIDDRTHSPLYGYAFHCIDGTGIVCDNCRGTLIQGTRIVEERLRPTRELKERYKLGTFSHKNTEKGTLVAQAVWDAGYVNNWHQGSGLIVTGPTVSDFTRVLGNHIENAAQGIDIHSDHVVIANNVVDNAFIGMKAMHGSRHVMVTNNQFSRCVLWAIGLMSGSGASPAVPAADGRPARPANVDGGSLIAGNVISQFGHGDAWWMWRESSRAVFRFDNGQEASDPPLRDVLVTGNIIANPDADEFAPPLDSAAPRYHLAVRIEGGRDSSPRGLHFTGNVFPPGTEGVSNVPLEP